MQKLRFPKYTGGLSMVMAQLPLTTHLWSITCLVSLFRGEHTRRKMRVLRDSPSDPYFPQQGVPFLVRNRLFY